MQHVKETEERLGGKRYLSVAFDESEFGAESTMAVEVYSAEAGVGTSFSPQVAQSRFLHLATFSRVPNFGVFGRFRAFSGVFGRAKMGVFGRFRAFLGRQTSAG